MRELAQFAGCILENRLKLLKCENWCFFLKLQGSYIVELTFPKIFCLCVYPVGGDQALQSFKINLSAPLKTYMFKKREYFRKLHSKKESF